MKAKLPISMPGCKGEEEVENDTVVWRGEQVFKYWYGALENYQRAYVRYTVSLLTCKRSSQSLAASFFIPDAFWLKWRIVLLPNVST